MVDYFAIGLQGFSTGMGVIFANEVWSYFKKYREHMKKGVKTMLGNGFQYGKVP